jgi:hypothetical protein
MKNKFNLLIGLTAVLMSTISYANNLQCPTISDVQNASFVFAFKLGDEWLVGSDPITTEDNIDWTVAVEFRNDSIKSSAKAINYVMSMIKSEVLIYPTPKKRRDSTECHYSNNTEFYVIAVNPPAPNFSRTLFTK